MERLYDNYHSTATFCREFNIYLFKPYSFEEVFSFFLCEPKVLTSIKDVSRLYMNENVRKFIIGPVWVSCSQWYVSTLAAIHKQLMIVTADNGRAIWFYMIYMTVW